MKKLLIILFLYNGGLMAQLSGSAIKTSLKKQFVIDEFSKIDHIIQFNSDTIVVAGYISSQENPSVKNIVFRTLNGGKNWEQRNFKGNASIYDVHFDSSGRIWMGGSDETIHFSNDFAETWNNLTKPFDPSDRVLTIYMFDSLNGVAGGLSNGLAVTKDNWKTSTQIETPFDQKKYKVSQSYVFRRIEKAEILDSIILVNQNGHIYFSKLNNIAWKEFNVPVIDFNVDEQNSDWRITSLNNTVYRLDKDLNKIEVVKMPDSVFTLFANSSTFFSSLNEYCFSPINKIEIQLIQNNRDAEILTGQGLKSGFNYSALYIRIDSTFHLVTIEDGITEINSNVHFSGSELKKLLLSNENHRLNALSENLVFTEKDYNDYEKYYLKKIKLEALIERTSGFQHTDRVSLDHKYFKEYERLNNLIDQNIINKTYFFGAYNYGFFNITRPLLNLRVINENGDTLRISNNGSLYNGLPWSIEYNGVSKFSFNPAITKFINSIVSPAFESYENILAGDLIFHIIRQKIIEELEYKNELKN